MQGRPPESVEKRFWRKVVKTSTCWLWTGGPRGLSIGSRSNGTRGMIAAHRLAWELQYGKVPDGMCVLHSCQDKLCVRPNHLFLGSQQHALSRRDNSKLTGRPVTAMEDRFWEKVEKGSNCWEWTASKDNDGYGQIGYQNGEMIRAHRYSWILHFGEIPDGLFVCHHCDNPSCVRPDHLFLGTALANNRDKIRKGRAKNCRGESSGLSKLTDEQVAQIRRLYVPGKISQYALAKKFSVAVSNINNIVHRKTWTHIK